MLGWPAHTQRGDRSMRRAYDALDAEETGLATRLRPGFSTEAVQPPARVNVTCVTPLGEEVASTS